MASALGVGGAGFIGSNLARNLEESGDYNCTLADLWDAKARIRFENSPYAFVKTDIASDDEQLDDLVSKHDIVLNMASVASPQLYVQNPLDVVKLNLLDGSKVIDACVRHGKHLIHFSTSEVYGKSLGSPDPFKEEETNCVTGPIRSPRWIYSATKQLLDRIIHAHGAKGELDYTIVRPFNVVGPLIDHVMTGPEDGSPRVFSHFMSALINGEPLRLVDGGQSLRTFIHVDDTVAALKTILDNRDVTNRQIYNIGNPDNEIRIDNLAKMMRKTFIEKFSSSKSDIISVPSNEFYGEGYEDTDRRMPDISKMKELGWEPKISLQELFDQTMDYTWKNRDRLTQAAMDAIQS